MLLANVNGININYKVEGQGEPLVMIQGYSADMTGWKHQMPVLKDHFQLVVFDNRGAGKSDKPQGPYSTSLMAEDTIRLMEYLTIKRAHILGVSMGGMIAQEIAIRYPDRVLKLILGCSHAGTDNQLSGGTADMVAAWDLPVRKCTNRLLRVCCNRPLNRFFLIPLYQFKVSRLDEVEASGLLGQREAVRNHDAMDRLSLIKAPTLVISGTRDEVVKPSSSDLLAQKIPGSRQVQVEGGSHTFSWEMSKRFNQEVLNFLKNG